MFRKPTKIEKLQDTLSDTLDAIHDTLDSLPIDRYKAQAANTVSHGFETALSTAGTAIHLAADALGAMGGSAASKAAQAASVGRQAASRAGERVQSAAHEYGDRVGDTAADSIDHFIKGVQQRSQRAGKDVKRGRQAAEDAIERSRRAAVNKLPHVVVEDTTSKWMWMGVGLLAGAAVAVFLAPASGRRSRALVKDKLVKAGHQAGDLGEVALGKACDLKRRAAGTLAERIQRDAPDDADDSVIAERVRTELGANPATRDLERLNIDCAMGLITVRGRMADAHLQSQIEAVVRGVKGVREVRSELLLADSVEDSPIFVG